MLFSPLKKILHCVSVMWHYKWAVLRYFTETVWVVVFYSSQLYRGGIVHSSWKVYDISLLFWHEIPSWSIALMSIQQLRLVLVSFFFFFKRSQMEKWPVISWWLHLMLWYYYHIHEFMPPLSIASFLSTTERFFLICSFYLPTAKTWKNLYLDTAGTRDSLTL